MEMEGFGGTAVNEIARDESAGRGVTEKSILAGPVRTGRREIAFSPPDISEREIAEVADTLRSGWITTGPKTKLLEQKTAAYLGVNRAVCLNSQTACAETALRLLGIGKGDEVITTAYTYTASASVIAHVGAKIILVDTQKDSLEMDYDALEAAVNERTKAVIPVDLAGIPCDYERIFALLEGRKGSFHAENALQEALGRAAVLADTAHAFGAVYRGQPVGSVADFSSFSWHAVKNFTTAEGGALSWREIPGVEDETLYRQVQLFSLHGQSKDALAKTKAGSWEYDVLGTWYKCNMTDIMAAMGLAQFERYPAMLQKRKEIIRRYDAAFVPLGVRVLAHDSVGYVSSGHLYMTWVPGRGAGQRDEIITKMAERGVACNVHYKPLPLLTAYQKLGFAIRDYPNAYANYVNEISLPLHTKLTEEDVAYVIDTYRDILREYL